MYISFFFSDCPVFTFENGADSWLKQGSAFRHQPIYGGSPDFPGHAGHQGNWLIDSSRNVSSPCRWQNSSLGDDATGTMTSPPFIIRSSGLSFLIGGKVQALYLIIIRMILVMIMIVIIVIIIIIIIIIIRIKEILNLALIVHRNKT